MSEMNPQLHCLKENCKPLLKLYQICKFRWHLPLQPLVAWVTVNTGPKIITNISQIAKHKQFSLYLTIITTEACIITRNLMNKQK